MMSTRSAFWRWALVGAIASGVLLWAQAQSLGGPAGLLQVGETSDLRPLIESELGEVPLVPGPGHDGQIYYAMGLDLSGDEVAPLLDHGAYRYRRILFPLIASAFGVLGGDALLFGMIATTVLAAAVAAGATAAAGTRLGLSEWVGVAVVLNPGFWLSVRLLTADTVALALMASGLLMFLTRERLSIWAFALSTLAKDVYLVTPGGLSIGKSRRRWLLAIVPFVVLVIWMTWLTLTLGEGFTRRGNLSWPLTGIIDASVNWANFDAAEWLYVSFALASVGVGVAIGLLRRGWLRWSILGWSALGLISSNWVWDFGNNAARIFAPIAVLIVLGFGSYADASIAGTSTTLASRKVS